MKCSHTSLQALLAAVALTGLLAIEPAEASVPAVACDALSAQRLALGDDYFSPSSVAETSGKLSRVRAHSWLMSLPEHSLRRGTGTREICIGSGASARSVVTHFDIEQVEFRETLSGQIFIKAFEDRHTVTANRDDRRSAGTLASATLELPAHLHWEAASDGQSIMSSRRFYRQAAQAARTSDASTDAYSGAGGNLIQIDMTARRLAGNGVELSETTYINGHRGSHVVWRLTR